MNSSESSLVEELRSPPPKLRSKARPHYAEVDLNSSLYGRPSHQPDRSWTLDLGLPAQNVRASRDYNSLAHRAARKPKLGRAKKAPLGHVSSSSSSGVPCPVPKKRKAGKPRNQQPAPKSLEVQSSNPSLRGYNGDYSSSTSGRMTAPSAESSLPQSAPSPFLSPSLEYQVVQNMLALRSSPSPAQSQIPSSPLQTPSSRSVGRRRSFDAHDTQSSDGRDLSWRLGHNKSSSNVESLRQIQQMRRIEDLFPDDDSDGSESVASWVSAPEDAQKEEGKKWKEMAASTDAAVEFCIKTSGLEQRSSILRSSQMWMSTSPPLSPTGQRIAFTAAPRRPRMAGSDSDHELSSVSTHLGVGDFPIKLPQHVDPVRRKTTVGPSFFPAAKKQTRKNPKKEPKHLNNTWDRGLERVESAATPVSASSGGFLSPLPSELSDTRRHTFLAQSDTGPQIRRIGTVSGSSLADSVNLMLGPKLFAPLALVPPTAWLFVLGFILPPLWWMGALYPITDENGEKEYLGGIRRSPMISARTSTSSSDPEKTLHQRQIESMRTSVGPLSGWKTSQHNNKIPDFHQKSGGLFSECQRIEGDTARSFWLRQAAIHTWKVRCRLFAFLSVFIIIPIIVVGVVVASG